MLVKESDGLVEIGFLMLSALHWKVPSVLVNSLMIMFIMLPLIVHSIFLNPKISLQFSSAEEPGG